MSTYRSRHSPLLLVPKPCTTVPPVPNSSITYAIRPQILATPPLLPPILVPPIPHTPKSWNLLSLPLNLGASNPPVPKSWPPPACPSSWEELCGP